jgi:hypothetical protein
VWCGLLRRGVMVVSRKDDAELVDDLLNLAGAVGRRIGEDRIDQWTVSGPTNIAMHAVRSAVELGDPRKALRLAEDVPCSASLPAAWWNRHLLVNLDTAKNGIVGSVQMKAPLWCKQGGHDRQAVLGRRPVIRACCGSSGPCRGRR